MAASFCTPSAVSSVSVSRLGNKSDTVDLLKRGFALAHRLERRVAQEARAAAARRVLQLAQRRAAGDELAHLVVQHEELGDRLAPLVAGAPAFAAALAEHEVPVERGLRLEPRFGQGVTGR